MNPIREIVIPEDLEILIEKSTDFGQDIVQSFVRLAEVIENKGEPRECYGIIQKNDLGELEYYGGFTQLYPGEAEKKNIPIFTIPKGIYFSILIEKWNQKILEIGPTFDQILKSGKVEVNSPCIEFYQSEEDLICMVKGK